MEPFTAGIVIAITAVVAFCAGAIWRHKKGIPIERTLLRVTGTRELMQKAIKETEAIWKDG